MLSVDRINKLEEENAKLLGQLDAYKMSENEANEIIAELKHKNKVQKEENKKFQKYKTNYNEQRKTGKGICRNKHTLFG